MVLLPRGVRMPVSCRLGPRAIARLNQNVKAPPEENPSRLRLHAAMYIIAQMFLKARVSTQTERTWNPNEANLLPPHQSPEVELHIERLAREQGLGPEHARHRPHDQHRCQCQQDCR